MIVSLQLRLSEWGFSFQHELWGRLRAQPSALGGIVRLLLVPHAFHDALSLLKVLSRLSAGLEDDQKLLLDAGIVGAYFSVMQSGKQPGQRALAATAFVSLAEPCTAFQAAGFAEALVAIFTLPARAVPAPRAQPRAGRAEPEHIPVPEPIPVLAALDALSEVMRSRPGFDAELLRVDAPRAVVAQIEGFRGPDIAVPQYAHRAHAALARFAARLVENATAVFRAGGVPELVAALAEGPGEAEREAAAAALRYMAAPDLRIADEVLQKMLMSERSEVRENSREARRRMNAQQAAS